MEKDANRIGIWGGSGSGKSTRLKELLAKDPYPQIVLDPLDDWRTNKKYKTVHSPAELFREVKKRWFTKFMIVYAVDLRKIDPQSAIDTVSKGLFLMQEPYNQGKDSRMINLIVDEMADFYPNKMSMQSNEFYHLSRKGRHYGVNIYGASQRLAEVHTSFRGNARENYFFRQDSAVDVQRALQSLGTEHKEALLSLKDHEYLHKEQGRVTKGRNKARF